MKKAFILCTALCLNACIYAGEMDVWSGRRSWFDSFNSHSIVYKDNAPKLVKTEEINEKSFKLKELNTAYKGYSVLSDKTFERNTYITEKVRANSHIILSNSSTPYEYKENETLDIVGYVTLKDVECALIPTDLENFVVLANAKTGEVYDHTGMINKDGRLVVLRQVFVPSDKNFRFEPVFITKVKQSKPIKGFDVKFDGVRMGRMWFIYYDYADATTGGFKEYSFPAKPGLIRLHNLKIRILDVDEQRVEYMILED